MNRDCNFCTNLLNISPAKLFTDSVNGYSELIKDAKKHNEWILKLFDGHANVYSITDRCPVCGYVFTTEDYDNYEENINM